MGQVTINGVKYVGNNITIKNNKIIVDGNDVTPDSKTINIIVSGDVNDLSADYCDLLHINGNVGNLHSGGGDVTCYDVGGSINTGSGNVTCNIINGNVSTGSGDVESNVIRGMVNTRSGDIIYKN